MWNRWFPPRFGSPSAGRLPHRQHGQPYCAHHGLPFEGQGWRGDGGSSWRRPCQRAPGQLERRAPGHTIVFYSGAGCLRNSPSACRGGAFAQLRGCSLELASFPLLGGGSSRQPGGPHHYKVGRDCGEAYLRCSPGRRRTVDYDCPGGPGPAGEWLGGV